MRKFIATTAVLAMASAGLMMPANATVTSIGPHAGVCARGDSSVVVRISGFRVRSGRVRVQLYAANPHTFLERGAWLQRIDVPTTASGDMNVCVPVESGAGRYAISVRHDANGNGNNDRADGGGFSGNPRVSLFDLALRRKPNLEQVAFNVGNAPARVHVVLNYVQGTRFAPIAR